LRDPALDVCGWLKKNLHDCDSIKRLRFDVLDVVDRRREGALGDENDTVAHILRI
jgi:hypothetical protein